jgi:hypothetical protein
VDSYESQLLPPLQLQVQESESYFLGPRQQQPALEQKQVARKLLKTPQSRLGQPTTLYLKLEVQQYCFVLKLAYLLTLQFVRMKGAQLHSILLPKICSAPATAQSLTHLMAQR